MLHRSIAAAVSPYDGLSGHHAPRLFLALGLGLALALAPALRADALGAPDSFADLAEQISPSVVNIRTLEKVRPSTPGAAGCRNPGTPGARDYC